MLLATACGSDDDTSSTTVAPAAGELPPADEPSEPLTEPACLEDEPDCDDTLVVDEEPQDLPDATDGEERTAELIGRWEITDYALPAGGLTNVVGEQGAFVEFGADGTANYHTGCNAGSTEWATSGTYVVPESALDDAEEGQTIMIGPSFQQTEIGCQGFLGEQDVDLPAAMRAATRLTITDDGRLLLLDEFLLIQSHRTG